MKTTRRIMTTAAVLALSTTLAFAGPGKGEGKRGHGRHGAHGFAGERFAQKLNLTDAQKEQARALHQTFREQNRPYFEAAKATRQEYKAAKQAGDTAKAEALKATMRTQREQQKERMEAQHAQFLTILTAEQRAQLEQLKAERKSKGGREGKHGRGGRQ